MKMKTGKVTGKKEDLPANLSFEALLIKIWPHCFLYLYSSSAQKYSLNFVGIF